MKSLRANISHLPTSDRRGHARWRVELILSAGPAHEKGTVLVRNLSERGLMLQTDAELEMGEVIQIDLPGTDPVEARVLWRQEYSYGCAFLIPVPSAVVSAALLQAPLSGHDPDSPDSRLEEIPVGVSPSIDELAEWKEDFKRSRGAEGYRIIAFRQTTGGLLIAIVGKADRH